MGNCFLVVSGIIVYSVEYNFWANLQVCVILGWWWWHTWAKWVWGWRRVKDQRRNFSLSRNDWIKNGKGLKCKYSFKKWQTSIDIFAQMEPWLQSSNPWILQKDWFRSSDLPQCQIKEWEKSLHLNLLKGLNILPFFFFFLSGLSQCWLDRFSLDMPMLCIL